ncbi:hypothetical protein [Streptomyces bauhiniae]
MTTKEMTVTIPEDLLDEIRADAAERGLSAYVAEALRAKRDRDRLLELVDWLQEEHGAVTEGRRRPGEGGTGRGRGQEGVTRPCIAFSASPFVLERIA